MTELFTASYRAYRASMGTPVIISLQRPKWRPESADWPSCALLTPRWRYFRADDFAEQYVGQLEKYGAKKIAAALHAIAREHDTERLVLCCFEADVDHCHRGMFAAWWLQTTGEVVTEVN